MNTYYSQIQQTITNYQLKLKQYQIMNHNLKHELNLINNKMESYFQIIKKEKDHKQQLSKLNDKIQSLKTEINEKNDLIHDLQYKFVSNIDIEGEVSEPAKTKEN